MRQGCFFFFSLFSRNFNYQFIKQIHRFVIFMNNVEMHQMRKLVLDNDQRCPVPLNEKKRYRLRGQIRPGLRWGRSPLDRSLCGQAPYSEQTDAKRLHSTVLGGALRRPFWNLAPVIKETYSLHGCFLVPMTESSYNYWTWPIDPRKFKRLSNRLVNIR